jgi:hypothetical protein
MKISRILVPQVPYFPFPQNIDYPQWCLYRFSLYKTAQFSSIQYYIGLIALRRIFPLGLRSLFFSYCLSHLKPLSISYSTWVLWLTFPSISYHFVWKTQILKMWDMWNWMFSNFYLYFKISLSIAKLAFLYSISSLSYIWCGLSSFESKGVIVET